MKNLVKGMFLGAVIGGVIGSVASDEITDIKNIMKKKLKVKEEQLLVMKMNNEKITSLYEQKSQFLENEASSWKNKYHDALIETKNKENELNKENIKLKEQNFYYSYFYFLKRFFYFYFLQIFFLIIYFVLLI